MTYDLDCIAFDVFTSPYLSPSCVALLGTHLHVLPCPQGRSSRVRALEGVCKIYIPSPICHVVQKWTVSEANSGIGQALRHLWQPSTHMEQLAKQQHQYFSTLRKPVFAVHVPAGRANLLGNRITWPLCADAPFALDSLILGVVRSHFVFRSSSLASAWRAWLKDCSDASACCLTIPKSLSLRCGTPAPCARGQTC